MVKLCKDCKWSKGYEKVLECNCPKQPMEMDYSIGKKKPRWVFCETLRGSGLFWSLIDGTCGKQGRFFEKRKEMKQDEDRWDK